MKRAVIYARVSTERQADEGLSVDSQIEACRRKADELGAVVVQVYRDDGISGTTDARPGFRSAINHCLAARLDIMLVWSSSRFARDQHDAISYKRELAAGGTRLVYASQQLDLDTHEGWLTDSFQQIIDENYSRQVSADTKRSMIKAARDGYFMGGRVPYGYAAVLAECGRRRRLVPQPEEAALVREIFEASARQVGAFTIAVQLNGQGSTLRGRPWTKNTILNLLKNEVYMGDVVYNRFDRKRDRRRPETEWVRVRSHAPLVSAELFGAVQAGTAARAPTDGHVPAHSAHVFSGLMRCGLCGAALKIANGTGRNGTVYNYYACRGHLQGRVCSFKRLPAEAFDRWMVGELLGHVLTRENVQGVIDQLDQAATQWVKDRARRRSAMVLELRGLETRRGKLFDVLEVHGRDAPGISDMGPRIRELNQQIDRIEKALVALEDELEPPVGPINVSAEEATRVMRQMVTDCEDPQVLRAFVASIVEGIVIDATEVRVNYHPECLVRAAGGAVVHSTRNWLPVVGRLRTATAIVRRPGRADLLLRMVA